MEDIKIASVAMNNRIGQADLQIKDMEKWARKAVKKGAEFILFPELGVNGYFHSTDTLLVAESVPGPSTDKLIKIAEKLKTILCFGILEKDADIVYNTQVIVNGNGILGTQRKIHMPGAEYLYWRSGFETNVIDIGKARVGITICYDSLFSELARTLYFQGAEILAMPFAYNTMHRKKFPEEHITALTYRSHCWTNGCFGVICNNAGSRRKNKYEPKGKKFPGWAGVFSPEGEVLAFTRKPGTGEDMVVTECKAKILNQRRKSAFFIPRCLHPEVYKGING